MTTRTKAPTNDFMTFLRVSEAGKFAKAQADLFTGREIGEWYRGRADQLLWAAHDANKLIMEGAGPDGDKVLDRQAGLVKEMETLNEALNTRAAR